MAINNIDQKISSLNFQTSVRWIALLPLKQLFPNIPTKNIALNLQQFEIPEVRMSTADTQYLGYNVEIPTFVRTGDKTITFNYILSSDAMQYKYIYSWFSKITKEEGTGANFDSLDEVCLPVTILLLSEYKKPTLEIVFENAWVKSLGPLSLDYSDGDASVVKHSFTLAYLRQVINDPSEPQS